jgi:hypothetical protein
MPGIYNKYEFLKKANKIAGYTPDYFIWVILVSLLFILRNFII